MHICFLHADYFGVNCCILNIMEKRLVEPCGSSVTSFGTLYGKQAEIDTIGGNEEANFTKPQCKFYSDQKHQQPTSSTPALSDSSCKTSPEAILIVQLCFDPGPLINNKQTFAVV